MKIQAYVIDDCLILSGANLSEEYFTDRQDRYMEFTNGKSVILLNLFTNQTR
jgi:CDP-diacylglycerol--glycerol-3-phosphate 3-phosphatidyltransferase